MRYFTEVDKLEAIEIAKEKGVEAASRETGINVDTILYWLREDGIDPGDLDEELTEDMLILSEFDLL